MFSPEVKKYAEVIWEYHHMHQPREHADLMLVLGSHDLRVPRYAAPLYRDGLASHLIVSGGVAHNDDLLKTGWEKTEAEMFRDVMVYGGVPVEAIMLETAARNTGENFSLSRKILEEKGVNFESVLVITKPYMERRAFATGTKQWPDKKIIVSSPQVSFDEYFEEHQDQDRGRDQDQDEMPSPEDVLNIMMGDFQRIDIYGRKGFQTPQEIPPHAWEAFEYLKKLGYNKHLLPEA